MIPISSGTHTTAGTTEETLVVIAAPGRYRLALDLTTVVGGVTPDIYEVRIKAPVLAGGTERLLRLLPYTGGLVPEPVQDSGEFVLPATGTITIKRAQGSTDRAIPWALLRERPIGTVTADAANTASAFRTSLAGGDDAWNEAGLRFLTGTLAGQVRKITDFADANNVVTVSPAFTAIPTGTDVFELVNV